MDLRHQSRGSTAPANRLRGRAAAGWLLAGWLALGAAGCTGPSGAASPAAPVAPAPEAAATECPAERIQVTSLSWFQDSQGVWRVVGMIDNQWDQPISKIVTDVEALDARGEVIDHGEDISDYPLNLAPGAQAPFNAWIKRDFPGTLSWRVEVSECVVAEKLERGRVDVRGGQLLMDGSARAHVTGEVVNTGTKPVLVNGLRAALFDKAGAPVAVENAAVSARYLAPGEQGPVRVTLDLPPTAPSQVAGYRLYMDTVVADPKPALLDAARDVQVTSRYVDAGGRLHMVGEVTNHGETSLTLRLQATLYDDPGRTTAADAADLALFLPLAPGETRPFDFDDWGPANGRRGLAERLAASGTQAMVRADLLESWAGTAAKTRLDLPDTPPTFTAGEASFAGTIHNDTARPVSEVLVTVALRERARGRLLATAAAQLIPAEPVAAGGTLDYQLSVPLAPAFDTRSVDYSVTALAQ